MSRLNDVFRWAMMNDTQVQFCGGAEGKNGVIKNSYSGAAAAGVPIDIEITDGDGTTSILNSISSIEVSVAAVSTAPGITLNGAASPLTLQFKQGAASLVVRASGPGIVNLALGDAIHPHVELNVGDTAEVTLS